MPKCCNVDGSQHCTVLGSEGIASCGLVCGCSFTPSSFASESLSGTSMRGGEVKMNSHKSENEPLTGFNTDKVKCAIEKMMIA